jgi:beta-glucosidase
LTNDGVLPLDPKASIALVGPLADDVRLLQGDYHYPAHLEIVMGRNDTLGDAAPGMFFTPHVTPLEAISAIAPETRYAAGCAVAGDETTGVADAVALAAAADVAVLCVGGRSGLVPDSTVGEARDATDLALTGPQEDLIKAVAATGTPTVVAVISGRVHTLGSILDSANALLWMAPPGEEAGHGLADVLFGVTDPGGRLPVSLPRHVGQVPIYAAHRAGGGLSTWYRDYTDSSASPLFAFGHGLSYTTWDYSDLTVRPRADRVMVSVRVTNSGSRYGSEVVQLYMTDRVASVARPVRQLVGFTRVACEPGQRAAVTFDVHLSRLAFYDVDMRFVVEPGEFAVRVGGLESRFTLEAPTREFVQREVVATTAAVSLG